MVASDTVFAGAVPEVYDRYLVPLIFEPYARDLAQRVAKADPRNVLETATGTGALTRELATRLARNAHITATDLNPPMLNHAMARQPDDKRITWKQADALALPFADRSFDAVACQFGAMFFPDKVQGYKEALRVLKPGGRYFFNVWDRISDNHFADTVTDALALVFPHDPPRFMVRTPHGYHDVERIRADLAAAGFANVSIDGVDAASKASSPREAAVAYCQGTPLRGEIEARDGTSLARATDRVTELLAERFGTGAIEGRIRALVITAVC